MAIMEMRVYGVLAGNEARTDNKSGLKYQKVSLMTEGGKKLEFKVMGPFHGFGDRTWGDKITVNIDSPNLILANYGDMLFECAGMVLATAKPNAAAPASPLKAAA